MISQTSLRLRNFMTFRRADGAVRGITQQLDLCSGHTMPSLGFGTYRCAPSEVGPAVSYAIECGYRHIDCAKIYLNEKEVGNALSDALRAKKVQREHLFVTSKIWPTDQSPEHVEKACRGTLADLQLDYLDLYLIHWPVCWEHTGSFASEEDRRPADPTTGLARVNKAVRLADTWKAMQALVDKGLVRSIGLSNCNAAHIDEVMEVSTEKASHRPVTNQIEFHPGCYQSMAWAQHQANQMVTTAYCPLGMPTRFTPPSFKGVLNSELLKPVSVQTGFSVGRVLLNWNLDMGNAVIVKSLNKERILENSKAARFALSDSVRWFLNHYEDQFQSVRVINPRNFRDVEGPFFPPREKGRGENIETL